MKNPKLTYQVLAFKALNRDVTEIWIEWAIQMLLAGHESEHLIILAGISKPYIQFYLQDLTAKVFEELSLDYSSKEISIRNYSAYLAGEVLAGSRDYRKVLSELKDLCIELRYEKFLVDFYLLFFAFDDLQYSDNQHYWPTATKENINVIILEYFRTWVAAQEKYRCQLIDT